MSREAAEEYRREHSDSEGEAEASIWALFERELVVATKTGARETRDGFYTVYNDLALSILVWEDQRVAKPRPSGMVLQDLANRRPHGWWLARSSGRG